MTNKVHDPAKFQIGLKVLLANQQNEFLLLEATGRWQGFYDLPGGRINNDEINLGFHKIIDREIIEELGSDVRYDLRPDPVSLSKYIYEKNQPRFFILFESRYKKGRISISQEHRGYIWKKLTEVDIDKYFHPVFQELMYNYFSWNR